MGGEAGEDRGGVVEFVVGGGGGGPMDLWGKQRLEAWPVADLDEGQEVAHDRYLLGHAQKCAQLACKRTIALNSTDVLADAGC